MIDTFASRSDIRFALCNRFITAITAAALIAAAMFLASHVQAATATATEAPAVVSEIKGRLQDAPVLSGEFEQRKTIRGFKNPLVSRGSFLVARARGVVWETRTPIVSKLSMTRERIVAKQADGSVVKSIDAAREPGMRAVSETLFALMSLDLAVLNERFNMSGSLGPAGTWTLSLTPRDASLAKWIRRVDLEGDRFVRSVMLIEATEAGDDLTQIRFTQQAASSALTPDQAVRFD